MTASVFAQGQLDRHVVNGRAGERSRWRGRTADMDMSEHILQRMYFIENTFYREHIL